MLAATGAAWAERNGRWQIEMYQQFSF